MLKKKIFFTKCEFEIDHGVVSTRDDLSDWGRFSRPNSIRSIVMRVSLQIWKWTIFVEPLSFDKVISIRLDIQLQFVPRER